MVILLRKFNFFWSWILIICYFVCLTNEQLSSGEENTLKEALLLIDILRAGPSNLLGAFEASNETDPDASSTCLPTTGDGNDTSTDYLASETNVSIRQVVTTSNTAVLPLTTAAPPRAASPPPAISPPPVASATSPPPTASKARVASPPPRTSPPTSPRLANSPPYRRAGGGSLLKNKSKKVEKKRKVAKQKIAHRSEDVITTQVVTELLREFNDSTLDMSNRIANSTTNSTTTVNATTHNATTFSTKTHSTTTHSTTTHSTTTHSTTTHSTTTHSTTTHSTTKKKSTRNTIMGISTLKIHLAGSTRYPIPFPENHAFCYYNPRNPLCSAL